MQIQVNELEHCKLKVIYQANPEQISNKREEVVKAFKRAPVPGFRPGKATPSAIKIHYRDQIEESLKRALAEEAFHNTIFEKNIKPHGPPRFNSLFMADGKFTCEFDLLTKPNFELSNFKNFEVPKPHESEQPSEITEKMMQELRLRFGEITPYTDEDFIQNGDSVILDYEGFVDGQKVDNLSAEAEMHSVGQGKIKDFDDAILGMKAGETREFDIHVAETGLPSVANKTVHFKVTLNIGSKTVPHPLDDALAAKMGKATLEELRNAVLSSAQLQLSNAFKTKINDVVCQKLIRENSFQVPHWMSLSEAQYLAYNSKLDWTTLPDVDKEKYIELAERNVKLSLILDKIRESEPEAQLSDQEVFDMIKQNIANTKVNQPVDEIIKEMSRTGYLQILFARIRDEYTIDFVVKNTRIIE